MRAARLLAVTTGLLLTVTGGLAQESAVDPAIRIPRAPSSAGASGNFLSRVNEFMMVRAKDHPEWWMDQRVYREGTAISPSFIVVVGGRGSFLVRVRSFKDLSAEQQRAVVDDPLWLSFLRAKRDKVLYPGSSTIYKTTSQASDEGMVPVVGIRDNEQPVVYAVTIDPAEMIRRRPVEVRLAGSRANTTEKSPQ